MLFAPDIISQLKIVLNQFGNEYRIDNTEYWDRKK